jgi:hypothetical protein
MYSSFSSGESSSKPGGGSAGCAMGPSISSSGPLVGPPHATTVICRQERSGSIRDEESRGVRSLPVPGRGAFGRALISPDGRELFLTRVIDTPEGERAALVAVDPDGGQHLRVLFVAASGNPGHARAISADGRRLFIAAVGATVKTIDAVSGVELASVDVVHPGLNGSVSDLVLDETHNRLFVGLTFGGPMGPTGAIRVLDADSLIAMPVGTYLGSGVATLHADRTTGTVVAWTRLTVFSVNTVVATLG